MSEQQPPPYGSVVEEQPRGPHTGYSSFPQATAPTVPAQEAPPQYEVPKEGPYATTQQPTGYYPPSQGYSVPTADPYPGYQQATVHQTVVVTDINAYGPHRRTMECPSCHAHMTTNISHHQGALTWLTAGLICLFGCWLGCCLIPFAISDLQDVQHRCCNCNVHIGTYTRL